MSPRDGNVRTQVPRIPSRGSVHGSTELGPRGRARPAEGRLESAGRVPGGRCRVSDLRSAEPSPSAAAALPPARSREPSSPGLRGPQHLPWPAVSMGRLPRDAPRTLVSGAVFLSHVSQLLPREESDVLRQRPSQLCCSGVPAEWALAGAGSRSAQGSVSTIPADPALPAKRWGPRCPLLRQAPKPRPHTQQERRAHTRVQVHRSTHAGKPAK